jgi:hypothetical protein
MNEYYVYEWIRLDTNEPFYVGKGKENRWCILKRENNKHFNNIVKSIPVIVNMLLDNLEEKEAYQYECYYIWYYRDIIGYDMCNISDGGENPPTGSGIKNNNYGNYWTDKQKELLRNKMINRYHGKDNPNAKPIMCIETGEIFNCCLDAIIKYKIKTYSSLTIALNNRISRTAGGKHWIFITNKNKEYFLNDNNRFLYLLKCLANHKSIKYYIDINTNKTYNKKEIEQNFQISSRKFKSFILNNNNIILVNDYLQSLYLVINE